MAFNDPCLFSTLSLNGLRLKVKLGCHEEERQIPQTVRFDVLLRFASLPKGCSSDELTDTVCYAEMSHKVREVCERREYQLIEKLAWDAFVELKEIIPPRVKLLVKATKEKPPVEDLEGGTTFQVGDWESA